MNQFEASALSEDWALFRATTGQVTVGLGPFKSQTEPPADGVAFYVNDFALSDHAPWKVPTRVLSAPELTFAKASFNFDWSKPDPGQFAFVFAQIMAEIERGELKKSVPVVAERTSLSEEQRGKVIGSALTRICQLPGDYFPYGYSEQGVGFVGATPELLMFMRKARLKTMALAGTAAAAERDLFEIDQKEIREHEFVAQTISEKFSDVGMVRRGRRKVLDLKRLVHFHTPISVELYRNENPADMVKLLHPTPALGSLPGNERNFQSLLGWRDSLSCPKFFGAPFGLWDRGYFTCVVAIRGLHFDKTELSLPAGCGVIDESRLHNEWRELELKRSSVKTLLGL